MTQPSGKSPTFPLPLWLLDEVEKLCTMALDQTVSPNRIMYQANAVRFGCDRLRREKQGAEDAD